MELLISIQTESTMTIQEITISNSQKKKLLKLAELEDVLFQDDNGDLVVNVSAYKILKQDIAPISIEAVINEIQLDYSVSYFVFS
jgi:ribulose 1,5-bisphosphate synthetase/thiazole synthase